MGFHSSINPTREFKRVDGDGRSPNFSDDETLARLLSEHELKLSSMVRRHIGPRLAAKLDAGDVLNAAFLRARSRWRDRPPEPSDRYCWLYGIVRDQVRDEIRRALGATRSLDREFSLPDDSVAEVVM